jgi:hypothetical protein
VRLIRGCWNAWLAAGIQLSDGFAQNQPHATPLISKSARDRVLTIDDLIVAGPLLAAMQPTESLSNMGNVRAVN